MNSFCNSHVVPQFILKEIADVGMVYYGQSLHEENVFLPTKTGINNAFTFKLICRDCDKRNLQIMKCPKLITDLIIFFEEKFDTFRSGYQNTFIAYQHQNSRT